MRLTLLAAGLAALVAGCASAWPQNCVSGLDGISCRCQRLAIRILAAENGAPTPAGKLRFRCDDADLPLKLDAAQVVKP